MPPPVARPSPPAEALEARTLLSSSFPNVNLSPTFGNQGAGAIAFDPTDPSRAFAVSNVDTTDRMIAATSGDGGATWASRPIAGGGDGLPQACCDASAAFDRFGNLFVTYVGVRRKELDLLLSTDAGHTFSVLGRFAGADEPTVATGAGSVWLTFQKGHSIVVTGARVTGAGAVGAFLPVQAIRGSFNANFGDIAVGPSGEVMVTYQVQHSTTASDILVNVNRGLSSPGFGGPVRAATTHVPAFDLFPAMPDWGADAEAGLAFDRSGGPFNGRAYLVYTEETPAAGGNLDVMLRYSDTGGRTWSQPVRVNDDNTLNSQFLPRIAADDTTGNVAVSWYDARNDQGDHGPGDTNGKPNDDSEFFAALVTPQPGGVAVSPNVQVSAGVSDSRDALSSVDFGDYTGLAFQSGALHPLWFDNSNSTGDNPNGTLMGLNPYTASVPAAAFAPGVMSLGGLAGPPAAPGPVAALSFRGGANPGSVRRGGVYAITVMYSGGAGVSPSSLGDANLLVTGPGGFSSPARLVRARRARATSMLATYSVAAPDGKWLTTSDGTYTIALQPHQVLDAAGQPSGAGILGTFAVTVGRGRQSRNGGVHSHHL